jgi:hypothetical protein
MTRRFVIGVESLTPEQEEKFRKFLDRSNSGFWHWISNFWLIATDDRKIDASEIVDAIKKINPDARAIAIEFPADLDWATLGKKNAKGQTMSGWLEKVWEPD